MNAEELLFNALLATGFAVYPQYAPQNVKAPYVVYNVTADNTVYTLNDVSNIQDARIQVDIYVAPGRDSYTKLKRMTKRVKDAIYDLKPQDGRVIIYGSMDTATEEGRRCKIDLKVWVRP